MTVRKATPADEPGLAELDRLTWSELASPAPGPSPRFDSSGTLVAEDDDGVVAGYVQLRQPTPHESSSHVLQIQGLAVNPARQRRGIARALLEAAAEEAAARGARRLTLRVFATNDAARALYEAAGFEVEGVLRGEFRVRDAYVDDLLMARTITPGPRPRTP